MGASLQWRQPPEGRDNRRFGDMVEFGTRRHRGAGYMAYSDRAGPGVVVLHDGEALSDGVVTLADRFNDDGFTVLAPDLESVSHRRDGAEALALIGVAVDHLVENWHPRIGLVGFGRGARLTTEIGNQRKLDAVVVYYDVGALDVDRWSSPLIGHVPAGAVESAQRVFEAVAGRGIDADLYAYEAKAGFAEPGSSSYDRQAAGQAHARTRDDLLYFLS